MDYITYERLRHYYIQFRHLIRQMDYITYERLRHTSSYVISIWFFLDYITYERLRPCILTKMLIRNSRITLPMRDWDYQHRIMLMFLLLGLHYLWEIETQQFLQQHQHQYHRITLPMRDWDFLLPFICINFNYGLHYLWEIETFHLQGLRQI